MINALFPTPRRLGFAACLLAVAACCARAGEEEPKRRLRSDPTQEYWVYLPGDFDAAKRYWLFVAVHGLGGNGENALGWAKFADEGRCIVVGPTFTGTYQFPKAGSGHGKALIEIVKELGKQYKLERKFFITGFSAGAQFAHRFTLECAQYVVGCAAHSAGSWGSPNTKARYVPFVVTCGEDDKSRIHIARNFADDLKRKGYKVTSAWYKGVAHSMCGEARELTRDLYWAATTGMTVEERDKATKLLEEGKKLFEDGQYAQALQALLPLARAKRENEFSERATSILRQASKLGAEKLAAIQEQAKTDPEAAAEALAQFQDAFKGFRVARAAAALLAQLKSGAGADPGTAPEVASDPPTEAKPQPEPPAKPSSATAGGQPTATAARWLALARNFLANDKKDMARSYLQRIIARFPDSNEATTAKEMLMEMGDS